MCRNKKTWNFFIHKKISAQWITDLLFPLSCIACNAPYTILCVSCQKKLSPAPHQIQKKMVGIFPYSHPLTKRLVKALKHDRPRAAATLCGTLIYTHYVKKIIQEFPHGSFFCVPIPPSRQKQSYRLFSPTHFMTRSLTRLNTRLLFMPSVLKRRWRARPQTYAKTRQNRSRNARFMFTLSSRQKRTIAGKNIILIDDVLTTGATLGAAQRVLREGGAKEIYGCAFSYQQKFSS